MKRYRIDTLEQIMCDLIPSAQEWLVIPTITTVLIEKINVTALTYAVREAMVFHPYFATRLIKEEGAFYWQENNRNPVILEKKIEEDDVFGDKHNNYFPWSITYYDNRIFLCCAHQLTDGGGGAVFNSTIMEYYARYLRGDQSKIAEKTTREERLASEAALPSEVAYRKDAQAIYHPKAEIPSTLRPETLGVQKNVKRLSIDVKSLRKVSFGFDASPFALMTLIFSRACVPYLAGENKIVKLLIPQNIREYFDSQSLHYFTYGHPFYYFDDKMRNMSVQQVATIFRGRLDLLSDISNIEEKFSTFYEVGKQLHVPEVRAHVKAAFEGQVFDGTAITYTHLTHLGISDLASEYISNVYFEDIPAKPLISCCAINFADKVNLTITTLFADDDFIAHICEQLEELHVNCTVEEVSGQGKRYFVFSEDPDFYTV